MKRRQKTTSLSSRVNDYAKEGMYIFCKEKKLMACKHCDVRVNWKRKSVVYNYCDSETHKRNKARSESAASNKRQSSISDSFESAKKAKEDRETFIQSTVNAFVKANVPLHKLDHPNMRKWLNDYTPGSGDLPNARWLMQHYLPQIKKDYDNQLKDTLVGKKIAVLCDETTNRKGEVAFIILFKILPTDDNPEPLLVVAAVKILSACTGDQTSKAILQTLTEFNIAHDNVVALVSDSAAYMNLCARLLHELGLTNMIQIQCWAHKLDKIAKVFSDKLLKLNECIANTKKLFKNTRKRKHKYLQYLKDTYFFSKVKEPKLFPLPVMTRWGSWKNSVVYLRDYIEDVVAYAKTILESESVKPVDYFKKLSKEDIAIIKTEATFVVEYCTPVSNLLVQVEASKVPLCHLLYGQIRDVRKVFSIVKDAKDVKTVLYKETKSSLNSLSDSKRRNMEDRTRAVSKKCDQLFSGYLSNNSANSLFEAVRNLFDPSKIVMGSTDAKVVQAKENLPLLAAIPISNFRVLYALLADSVKEIVKSKSVKKESNDAVVDALLSMKANHPEFVSLCLQVLHLPVSNVDCERGFSAYGDVLSLKRCRLSPNNVEVMMCLYFGDDLNNNESDDLFEHSAFHHGYDELMNDDINPDDPQPT